MARNRTILLPRQQRLLSSLGENVRLARLRRRLSAAQVAERAGISRTTLYSLERGGAMISLGILLRVLSILGLEGDLGKVATDDLLGRKMQDADLTIRGRAPKSPEKA